MSRIITEHEMDRRKAMADAKCRLTEAMEKCSELTALEWINVLHEMTARMIQHGLAEEWSGQ